MTTTDLPICTTEAARAAGLDIAPTPDELEGMARSVVRELGHLVTPEVDLARAVPLMAAEIRRLRAEHQPYEAMTEQNCPTGQHASWLVDSPEHHACPWCEISRLTAEHERQMGEVIDDREAFHNLLDAMAAAVAPIEVIGEHSSGNNPWANAMELITPAAHVEQLTADRDRLQRELDEAARRKERYRIAWSLARTRALSTGGAADRAGARVRELQAALQEMLVPLLTGHICEEHEPNAVRELRAAVLREAADAVDAVFHGEPFLNYPPDFADHLRCMADAVTADDAPDPIELHVTSVTDVVLCDTGDVEIQATDTTGRPVLLHLSESQAAALRDDLPPQTDDDGDPIDERALGIDDRPARPGNWLHMNDGEGVAVVLAGVPRVLVQLDGNAVVADLADPAALHQFLSHRAPRGTGFDSWTTTDDDGYALTVRRLPDGSAEITVTSSSGVPFAALVDADAVADLRDHLAARVAGAVA